MQAVQFVEKNQQGIDEVRISEKTGIEAPFYAPELKGSEDLLALLQAQATLDPSNPIIVPGYRWKDLRSKPMFKEKKPEIQRLVSEHPIIYYEPVEILRYTMPQVLVTYAFQGNRSKSREFYKWLRNGEIDRAVEMLPTFFQPFLESQLESLINSTEGATAPPSLNTKKQKIYEAWRDDRADQGYDSYLQELVDDAGKSPNVSIVPPVPPILGSSGQDSINRTRGINRYMTRLCQSKNNGWSGNPVYSYFHLYVDQGIFKSSSNNNRKVIDAIESELVEYDYCGIALTISNYDRAWENNVDVPLEKFVNEVSNIARQYDLPVILPRSGRYGLHLTDQGAQCFSSLMNGNAKYTARSGGMGEEARYGTTALYGKGIDVNISNLEGVLRNQGGEVHPIDHLPSEPPTFSPSASDVKSKFGKARQFRINFSKPRRMLHVQEARELRNDLKSGVPRPARRYLERSLHPHLS